MPHRVSLLMSGTLLLSAGSLAARPNAHPLVLLISVDGMKPEAVLQAQTHGLKVPHLRAFVSEGTYADGVHGVLPTLTYPSHTTLLTGASPARHGIYANTTFDPLGRNDGGWYWYAEDIKVPTLWDAAAAAHLTSASIYWPVSVGANITYNLPQIWRRGTADDLKLQRALTTPGLEQELSARLGRYPGGEEEAVAQDELRARFAIDLMDKKHPDLVTVYLSGLDTEEHESGPFSAAADAVLERLDAVIGQLRAAAEREAPGGATICVVSDHGFAAVQHDVNLYTAFRNAALFDVDAAGKITSWLAMPWPAGGSAAIVLADKTNEPLRRRVRQLLDQLAGDPNNGIDQIMEGEEIAKAGGFPDAAFLVAFKIGYEGGALADAAGASTPLVKQSAYRGMHGYPPQRPEMRSSFFILGPGVARGRTLGEIDMRQIAPTLAAILHVHLDGAELPPLTVQ